MTKELKKFMEYETRKEHKPCDLKIKKLEAKIKRLEAYKTKYETAIEKASFRISSPIFKNERMQTKVARRMIQQIFEV